MTKDELQEQIRFCKQEARAMRAHRDHEFAKGALDAAARFERQLAGIEARVASRAANRCEAAETRRPGGAEGLPVAA